MIDQLSEKNKKYWYKNAPYLRPLVSVLLVYLTIVYLLTLNPFNFSTFYYYQYMQFNRGYLAAFIGGASVGDVLLNLFMLIPYGIVTGIIMRLASVNAKSAIAYATVSGFVISLSIEFFQLFLPRTSSGVDIITNTIGAACGAWLAYPTGKFDLHLLMLDLYDKDRSFYIRLVILYAILATAILFIPVSLNTFRNWDNGYHLFIGNEATQNRPWSGEVQKLMIFDRAINDNDIETLFNTDYQNSSLENRRNDLVIEYPFTPDRSKISGKLKDRLQFIASKPSESGQSVSNAYIFNDNNSLKSNTPASGLIELLKQANQVTIAIWIKPDNLRQVGPARIISLSKDTDHRNFTLGQSGARLNFRVRTPLTGLNGSKVELVTNRVLTAGSTQCVVATFHRGEYKLYIDGNRVAPVIYDTSFYLPMLINLGNNQFGKTAFCFTLLFPMGWLARGIVHSRIWKSVVSSLIVLVPFLILSSFTLFFLRHSFDLHLFYISSLISCFVLLIGLVSDLAIHD